MSKQFGIFNSVAVDLAAAYSAISIVSKSRGAESYVFIIALLLFYRMSVEILPYIRLCWKEKLNQFPYC